MRYFAWVFLVQFVMEFVHHDFGLIKSPFPRCGDSVHPSPSPGHILQIGLEHASTFHSVQKRIESSRSDAIAMMFKLFHHCQSKDRLVRSVYKDMDADETCKEFPMMC
jgi:hypothetical protein